MSKTPAPRCIACDGPIPTHAHEVCLGCWNNPSPEDRLMLAVMFPHGLPAAWATGTDG
jgi:hypothetical protein